MWSFHPEIRHFEKGGKPFCGAGKNIVLQTNGSRSRLLINVKWISPIWNIVLRLLLSSSSDFDIMRGKRLAGHHCNGNLWVHLKKSNQVDKDLKTKLCEEWMVEKAVPCARIRTDGWKLQGSIFQLNIGFHTVRVGHLIPQECCRYILQNGAGTRWSLRSLPIPWVHIYSIAQRSTLCTVEGAFRATLAAPEITTVPMPFQTL